MGKLDRERVIFVRHVIAISKSEFIMVSMAVPATVYTDMSGCGSKKSGNHIQMQPAEKIISNGRLCSVMCWRNFFKFFSLL